MTNKFQKWSNKEQFSFIIPCHKLFKRFDGRYEVDACIDSILDQDYNNYEMIVCANGPDRNKIVKHLEERYKDTDLKCVVTEPANAAIARNAGAMVAEGEFRSYFSCDLQLLPGALTQWKKGLDNNPKASIVYFNIHYVKDDEIMATSAQPEYDRYQHSCENLIDGAMPVRAKYDHPWHHDVEALQDWYWSYGVCQYADAVLIPGVYYLTEVPKEGGLSDTFRKNWLPINKKVRKYHNIPERDTVVTSIAAPFHALNLAKAIGADYKNAGALADEAKGYDYDYVWVLGVFPNTMQLVPKILNNAGKRTSARIVSWIGTDVKDMMDVSWKTNKILGENLKSLVDVQLSMSEFLQIELNEMDIQTEVAPLLPMTIPEYIGDRGAKKKRVAIYAPSVQQYDVEKYNLTLAAAVANAMPHVDFYFFGFETDSKPPLSNIKFVGKYDDFAKFAKKIDVYLRVIPHDGFPQTVIEFLLAGKEVLNYPVPMPGANLMPFVSFETAEEGKQAVEVVSERLQYILQNPASEEDRLSVRKQWIKFLDENKLEDIASKYKAIARKVADEKEEQFRIMHPDESLDS